MKKVTAAASSQPKQKAEPPKGKGLTGAQLEEYESRKGMNARRHVGRAAHHEGHAYILPNFTPTEARKRAAAREARESGK